MKVVRLARTSRPDTPHPHTNSIYSCELVVEENNAEIWRGKEMIGHGQILGVRSVPVSSELTPYQICFHLRCSNALSEWYEHWLVWFAPIDTKVKE